MSSTPHVADTLVIRGGAASPHAAPDLFIEVPHGSTATADFEALAAELQSPLPPGLVDFFHVNTDVGAYELAVATAERIVAVSAARCALIVRSRIPRTFIDCNRRMDAEPDAFREGGVTPAHLPWITAPADRDLLRSRYEAYLAHVRAATAALGPAGATLLLHTYAPRTVGVEVDEHIVSSLRRAYAPDVIDSWPLRPELDVIARDDRGEYHAPARVVDALRVGAARAGWSVGDTATYRLHPSALAWDHVAARPGRVLCLEVRRDLLADPFDPFAQMEIGREKVAQVATLLADAIGDWGVGARQRASGPM